MTKAISSSPESTKPDQMQDRAHLTTLPANVQTLLHLLKFASLINRPMQSDLAEKHQLTIHEVRVMMCVSGEAPIGGQAIADMMAMPPMNVSRALASLNQRGWTEPVPEAGNRRLRPVRLSAAGWDVYRHMMPDIATIADHLLQGMDIVADDGLAAMVALMVERLEQWHDSDDA